MIINKNMKLNKIIEAKEMIGLEIKISKFVSNKKKVKRPKIYFNAKNVTNTTTGTYVYRLDRSIS